MEFQSRKVLFRNIGIFLTVGVVGFVGFKYFSNGDAATIKAFGDKRSEVMSHYVFVIVGFSPAMLKGDASIPKCDRYSDYTAYFDKDSRKMTIADLKDALALQDSCHYDVTSDQYSLDNDLSSAISELVGIGAKFKNPDLAKVAGDITDTWRKIEQLESEKTDLRAKAVSNEGLYWQAELGYKQGNDSFSAREATFQRLNSESQSDSGRLDEIASQMKQLKTTEEDDWSIFKVKSGYAESTSTPDSK